ncbi:MAG: hypothetical protein QGF55_01285, partial [SAR324 cluster bacterium]|nr:hypothetical protein [SAR324 cluster bacterium]
FPTRFRASSDIDSSTSSLHPPIAPVTLLSMPPERYCGDIMLLGYVYLGLDASLVICFQNAN